MSRFGPASPPLQAAPRNSLIRGTRDFLAPSGGMIPAVRIGGSSVLSFLVAVGLLGEPNVEAAIACTKIEDDGARLACYDVQFGRARPPPLAPQVAGPQTPEVPAVVSVAAPAAAQASSIPARSKDDFGLTAEQRDARASSIEKTERIDRITAIVQSAKMTASSRLLITLDNGQQWVQVEPSRMQLFFEGDQITIRKASLGSFLASGPRSGTGVRIRRIE